MHRAAMRVLFITATFSVVFVGAFALFRDAGSAFMAGALVASAGALQTKPAR